MNYDPKYPSVADLKRRAQRRIPQFAFDYVDGAIDDEIGKRRNREAFANLQLTPRYLRDVAAADIRTTLFGKEYAMPFGVPPVGLGNMMWPGAEAALAAAAQQAGVPYVLSTFSTTDMEQIAELARDVCWFQLYVPREPATMRDLIARVKSAGFHALVVTLDIPVGAKRNRELRNGLRLPFRLTPRIIAECMRHPHWSLATLLHGMPDFVNVLRYKKDQSAGLAAFISDFNMPGVTKQRLREIRKLWQGPLILKGVQHAQDASDAMQLGTDGLIVSNHGGRQLDAAPASLDSLRALPDVIHNNLTLMLDSGVRTGLDVVRAKALGAQMAFSGRAFFYGVAALGKPGARQVIEIFRDEITRTLQQLGCESFARMNREWVT